MIKKSASHSETSHHIYGFKTLFLILVVSEIHLILQQYKVKLNFCNKGFLLPMHAFIYLSFYYYCTPHLPKKGKFIHLACHSIPWEFHRPKPFFKADMHYATSMFVSSTRLAVLYQYCDSRLKCYFFNM